MRDQPAMGTTLMGDRPAIRDLPAMGDHPYGRPPLWETALL